MEYTASVYLNIMLILVSNTNEGGTVIPSHLVPYANEDPRDYFCHRNGLVESAFEECISTLIFPHEDGDVVGSWILTE